jgi:hypothetical protein
MKTYGRVPQGGALFIPNDRVMIKMNAEGIYSITSTSNHTDIQYSHKIFTYSEERNEEGWWKN